MRHIRLAAPLMLGLAAATIPLFTPPAAQAQIAVGLSITIAPPVLPVYAQPVMPAAGYIWTPGYWAWADGGYYWVPGAWVMPPQPGLLWTPGYWACNPAGVFVRNAGYWGPKVGFYGGVNYGYGYGGAGYEGGYWQGQHFFYNRNVNNFGGVHVTNIYERNVVNNVTINRISYNGGHGGLAARPSPQEMQVQNQHRFDPTPAQRQQQTMAAGNKQMFANQNHGAPPIAATSRAGDFSAHNAVPAHNNGPGAMPQGQPPRPQQGANAMSQMQHPQQGAPQQRPEQTPQPMPQHQNNMMAPQQHANGAAQGQYPQQMQPIQQSRPQQAQPMPQQQPRPQQAQQPRPQGGQVNGPQAGQTNHPQGGGQPNRPQGGGQPERQQGPQQGGGPRN